MDFGSKNFPFNILGNDDIQHINLFKPGTRVPPDIVQIGIQLNCARFKAKYKKNSVLAFTF